MNQFSPKDEAHVLNIIRQFLIDSGALRASRSVSIDAHLEKELGLHIDGT